MPPRVTHAAHEVDIDVRHRDSRGGGLFAAAAQRPHPHHQLRQREGFGEVIVCAGLESGQPVVEAVAAGEHERGHRVPGGTRPGDQVQAVAVGQAAIHHQAVVAIDGDLEIRVGDALGEVHREPGRAQPIGHLTAELVIIL